MVRKYHPVLSIANMFLVDSPLPSNINYWYNYGSVLGLMLVIQLLTGILLSMHFTADVNLAFISVEHIMRDVNYGWLLRYCHANGASFFFIAIYLHIGRNLYYGSYTKPREFLWSIGVIIFILLIGTAFLGYVIVYGNMSLWAAIVITNLLSAIPWIGNDIVTFIWGGFAVDNPTLHRFFSLHFLLPFVLAALACVHLIALHQHGSTNPLGISSNIDKITFHPYYTVKDLLFFGIFLICYSYFVYFNPNVLGHTDNYIPANPLVTPPHITPEFYFLCFYAILRSIPNKLLGVIAMFGSLLVPLLLPYVHVSVVRSSSFRPLMKISFFFFVSIFFLLTWIGGNPVEPPFVNLGLILTVGYFSYFLILTPLLGLLENFLLMYLSINIKK
jgi:ubiquinol-cytochrome c reductase cytochrome b subunit